MTITVDSGYMDVKPQEEEQQQHHSSAVAADTGSRCTKLRRRRERFDDTFQNHRRWIPQIDESGSDIVSSTSGQKISRLALRGGTRGGGGGGNALRKWTTASIIIRFVGCLIVMDGIALTIFYKPEWIMIVLNGPSMSSREFLGQSTTTKTNTKTKTAPWKIVDTKANNDKQHPAQRPTGRSTIFRALTQSEKKGLKTMVESFKGLQSKSTADTWKSKKTMTPCSLGSILDGDCNHMIMRDSHLSKTAPKGTGSRWIDYFFGFIIQRKPPSSKKVLLLRNTLDVDRYWCGQRILGGGGTLEVITESMDKDSECYQNAVPAYLHTEGPPGLKGLNATGTPPVQLYWNFGESYGETLLNDFKPCSVPCRTTGPFEIINTINIKNTKWEITLTMEGEQYYSDARVHPLAFRSNHFYATTSFNSDVPVPYYSRAEYNIRSRQVDWGTAIKGASFIANNCASLNDREEIVRQLMNSPLRVDSVSGCLHNADPPNGVSTSNKTKVMQQYLFHLAFENQRSDDYITEKLWGSLEAGTLPVYYGAPNVKDHVPQNSIIVVDDFDSVSDLAEYLIRLTTDEVLYSSYHRWRTDPELFSAFQARYHFTDTHSTCRMCRWAYAKRSGLGWDHSQQDVMEPYISHRTCRNKVGLVGHPFKEYWLSDQYRPPKGVMVKSEEAIKTCHLTETNRAIEIDHGRFTRRIYDQDGVTDLVIDFNNRVSTNGVASDGGKNYGPQTYFLKIETPIIASHFTRNQTRLEAGQSTQGSVQWLQDSKSRMIILTHPVIPISVIDVGIVQFDVQAASSDRIRIRVLSENIDNFHHGARNDESYFGDLMTRDFFTPIESYIVVYG